MRLNFHESPSSHWCWWWCWWAKQNSNFAHLAKKLLLLRCLSVDHCGWWAFIPWDRKVSVVLADRSTNGRVEKRKTIIADSRGCFLQLLIIMLAVAEKFQNKWWYGEQIEDWLNRSINTFICANYRRLPTVDSLHWSPLVLGADDVVGLISWKRGFK